MIKSECTDFIKNKLQWTYTIYFFIGVLCIGAVLNYKSPYNYFWVLYPFLLIMLASTLGILKYALRKLDGFKEENRNMAVEREIAVLYFCWVPEPFCSGSSVMKCISDSRWL